MKINLFKSSFKFLPAFLLFFLFFFSQPTFAVNEICSDGQATCCTPPPIVAGGGGCDPIGGQPSYWIAGKCAVPSSTPYPCTTKFSCETGSCTSAPAGTSTCKSNQIHIGAGVCADWVSVIREKGSSLFKLWYGEILGRVVFLPDADCTDGYVPGWNNTTKKWECIQGDRWKTSTVNSNDIYYNTGNVGIGTADPKAQLHVQGKVLVSSVTNCSLVGANASGDLYCVCNDLCTLGTTKCDVKASSTCVTGALGCSVWQLVQICSASCGGDPNYCSLGTNTCISGNKHTCKLDSYQQCPIWSLSQTCSDGCVNGSCCPISCSLGSKQCSAGNVVTCSTGSSGCKEWKTTETCSYGCTSGTCNLPPCSTCSPSAPSYCSGDKKFYCGDIYGGDGDTPCYQWKSYTCPKGCDSSTGDCTGGVCAWECTLGERRCYNTWWMDECKATSTCNEFSTAFNCFTDFGGKLCENGVCVCNTNCTLGSKRCSGNSLEKCVPDAYGCQFWNIDQVCNSGCNSSTLTCNSSTPPPPPPPPPECRDECSYAGQRQCSRGSALTCTLNKTTGCLVWSSTSCRGGCSDGRCL